MPASYDALVIGAGLSGLAAAFDLVDKNHKTLILEAAPHVGGRTSNWKDNGMDVESGIHKFLGVYFQVKRLIRKAGLRVRDVFHYQDEFEIRVAAGGDRNADPQRRRRSGRIGVSLFANPGATLQGAFGNTALLPLRDKMALLRVIRRGIGDLRKDPVGLDQFTIADYARKQGASDNLINTFIWCFSGGLFFLPPEQYGAYPFFSLLWETVKRSYASRLAIFRGGMTDVMCGPIAEAIKKRGGEVRLSAPATRLLIENGRVVGVETAVGAFRAPRVVLATTIAPAKRIVRATYPDGNPPDEELRKLLTLPDMGGVAVQLELDVPSEPDDHIVFGPNSILGTFGEQSHITFPRRDGGRLSTFLCPIEPYLSSMSDEAVVAAVIADLKRQGVEVEGRVRRSIVVRHPSEFYFLGPGSESRRPRQKTTVPGLALAGDYTKQPFICSMEGAVRSGRLAAKAVLA